MDEKKKLIVVAVLVVVIACVGAFRFMGKSSPAPAPAAAGTSAGTPLASGPPAGAAPTGTTPSTATPGVANKGTTPGQPDAAEPIKNPQVANDLPARDPFNPPADALPHTGTPFKPVQPKAFRPSGLTNPGLRPLPPPPLGTELTPLPTSGDNRTAAKEEDKPFGYHVVGEISGDRPAVMLEDGSGNQKLVPVGSAIDGDSRVKRVENGAVVIEYRGKTLRLNVGGNPVGK